MSPTPMDTHRQAVFTSSAKGGTHPARASLLSLPWQSGNNGSRGGFRDQDFPMPEASQTPMPYGSGNNGGNTKTSGLRHAFSDRDNDEDSMEEALVHSHSPDEDAFGSNGGQRRMGSRM